MYTVSVAIKIGSNSYSDATKRVKETETDAVIAAIESPRQSGKVNVVQRF